MAKAIGYGCSLKLEWLNKAMELFSSDTEEIQFKELLNEYLSLYINNATRLRKTRQILMHIWHYDKPGMRELRQEALCLIQNKAEYAPAIHLCLLYVVYPVFADICRYTGKLLQFQDEITTPMLRQKLFEEWGERGALESISRRVTLTLKELGFLSSVKRTRYRVNQIVVDDPKLVNFLIYVALKSERVEYLPISELEHLSIMFPFIFHISNEQFIGDNRFLLNTFNSDLTIFAR